MHRILTGVIGLSLAVGTAWAADAGLRLLAQGPRSSVDKPERVVARTQADWEKLWARHLSRQTGGTPPPAPKVDWSKEMALAVFLGTRNTGGYRVEITGAQPQNGKLVVTVVERTPPPGSLTTQSITYPFFMAAVPKSDLPVEWKLSTTSGK